MSTEAISSAGYMGAYSLLKTANEEEQLYAQAAREDQQAASSGTAMGNEIRGYLNEVPKGSDNKLSFQDVDDYRKQLETVWDTAVMADLEKLGVDISQEFPLTYDPATGKVTVANGHKDKAVIDNYFENNPEAVEEFHKIVQLGKMTTNAATQLSQTNLMTSLQMDSLAWWYEDNTDPTSWFDGGGLVTGGTSPSTYSGLNLRV